MSANDQNRNDVDVTRKDVAMELARMLRSAMTKLVFFVLVVGVVVGLLAAGFILIDFTHPYIVGAVECVYQSILTIASLVPSLLVDIVVWGLTGLFYIVLFVSVWEWARQNAEARAMEEEECGSDV